MVRYRAERMRLVGTPEQIADELERWQNVGVDVINIINHIIPGSYTEVIEGLLPELRRRGLAQTEYRDGTFREKLFADVPGRPAGDGRLDARHPAAVHRGAFRGSAR